MKRHPFAKQEAALRRVRAQIRAAYERIEGIKQRLPAPRPANKR